MSEHESTGQADVFELTPELKPFVILAIRNGLNQIMENIEPNGRATYVDGSELLLCTVPQNDNELFEQCTIIQNPLIPSNENHLSLYISLPILLKPRHKNRDSYTKSIDFCFVVERNPSTEQPPEQLDPFEDFEVELAPKDMTVSEQVVTALCISILTTFVGMLLLNPEQRQEIFNTIDSFDISDTADAIREKLKSIFR